MRGGTPSAGAPLFLPPEPFRFEGLQDGCASMDSDRDPKGIATNSGLSFLGAGVGAGDGITTAVAIAVANAKAHIPGGTGAGPRAAFVPSQSPSPHLFLVPYVCPRILRGRFVTLGYRLGPPHGWP